ncbi:MAG TPA: trypsin-like peptidase domain-containing protein [Polyangiaceae bacterium]|nr:trypsin-like peptidase domain-containing protein [Polyangiaceae bacterium]
MRSHLSPLLVFAALSFPRVALADHDAAQIEARRLSDAFAGVAEKVSPSVVQVEVSVREQSSQAVRWYKSPSNGETAVQRGMGSGVIFNDSGAILTNNHVVEDALSITVRLRDGRILPARLIGRDPSTDLAVIRVDAKNLVPAKFADSDGVRVGDWVVAIGSPFGLGYTVTTGVVSAKGRGGVGVNQVEDYLQTDASINPGNSGGPLVNLDGQVLGINTMIVGRGQGIGFAVPSNLCRRTADQIVKTGRVQRAWIGVGIQDVSPEIAPELKVDPAAGALVNSVATDGPGAKAQLRPGDIVAAVDGKRVRDAQELIRELLARDVGQTALLEVVRGGKRYSTKVELAVRPEAPLSLVPAQQEASPAQGLGLAMRDLSADQAVQLGLPPRAFAAIVQVLPGSAGDRAGLRTGDIVIEADGVTEPNSGQVAQAGLDGHMLLRVRRRDAAFYAAVRK